jgi:anti-sigma regulatory factor (Ser/Thr protein kinase)
MMTALVLPGRPEAAAGARDFAGKVLAGYPAAGDAIIALNEMVTNAVQHSRSGLPGGTLEVRLTVTAASVLAEVVDDGPLGAPAAASRETFAERGRGLVLIEALTQAWGATGRGCWWFWLPLGGDPE